MKKTYIIILIIIVCIAIGSYMIYEESKAFSDAENFSERIDLRKLDSLKSIYKYNTDSLRKAK